METISDIKTGAIVEAMSRIESQIVRTGETRAEAIDGTVSMICHNGYDSATIAEGFGSAIKAGYVTVEELATAGYYLPR